MNPDQIMSLVQLVLNFIEWFIEHRQKSGTKLGPVRKAWLEHEYALLESHKTQLSAEQQQELEPKLQRIREFLDNQGQ